MADLKETPFQTALLVEPDLARRRALHRMLIAAGLRRVLESESALEALSMMGEELVDLVFTPWETPGMAGPSLIRAFHNRGRNRKVPVVLLDTGLPQPVIVSAVKAGISGRLPLPARPAILAGILQNIREGRAPARAAK